MKIGIIADTHWQDSSQFNIDIFSVFNDVDAIFHAGDVVDSSVLEILEAFRPTYAVYGNCDYSELQRFLPSKRYLDIGGYKVGLIHGWRRDSGHLRDLEKEFDKPQILIYGHSHAPLCEKIDDVLFFNPGSPTHPRNDSSPSVGIIEINGTVNGYHVSFP
ncbi:MAG: metallophosphoesterase family protein [Vulcanimicrobiota bacterium]